MKNRIENIIKHITWKKINKEEMKNALEKL
jgi:hypothetical protein